MTSFEYKPISLDGPAFRLLRLFKGDGDLIQGQLFESNLPSPEHIIDYEALSYTWGSESRPCEITINGSLMAITKNAYLALRDLRYQEKDRILWIDALCINQNDDRERGEQVQQMGSIYNKARRVIIWLGQATYDTDCIMSYMKQLEKEGTKHASNGQNVSDEQWANIWSAVAHGLSADRKDLLVEGLQSLLCRNWFKRVWVIQEVANARAAEIACGSKSVSASIFTPMLSLLKITPDPHCQPVLDLIPGHLRNSSWWAKKRDLYTLIVKFCESEATDPRDIIYALLDISSDACATDLLKADYEKNIQDVVFDTTSFLLNFKKIDSSICRFFDWELPEFLKNLSSLADEVLKCAMNTGHAAVVKLLLENGATLEIEDEDGQTPMFWAAKNGHELVVKLLLEKGAQLETKEERYGQTPLSWAAGNGRETVVRLLLEKGAQLEIEDNYGRTPLSLSILRRHDAVVKLLLERSTNLEAKDKNGWTTLMWAIDSGCEATIRLILEKGVQLETKDKNGWTALTWAISKGNEIVINLLLERGAQLETKDKYGQTPLILFIKRWFDTRITLLLEKGAQLETKDNDGRTALTWAINKGREEVVKLLLEKGAQLETKDNYGRTPLMLATKNGYESIVELLLDKGAQLETKDENGWTALTWAIYRGREVVVKLLLKKGAQLEIKGKDGRTPLILATMERHDAIAELLLEKGAQLETKDNDGRTALTWAIRLRHDALVRLLLEKGAKKQ